MKKIWNFLLTEKRYIDLLSYLLCILFAIAGILVSVNRFWQYEVFYYDFGIFDQAIWKVSQLRAPIIEHLIVGGKWIFADHFSPSIFLLAPFYWLTAKSEMLLVVQAISVGFSGVILYKIGIGILKNKLSALCVLICYLFFLGLQNAVISDFHELTIMTLPLMLTFWAIVHRKRWYYFLFFIITLGFKESTFLLGISIGILIFFLRREWLKIGLITIFLSIVWGYLSIKVIIPAFSNGFYLYMPSLSANLFDNVQAFVDNPLKQRTLFYSLWSFSFLSFLAPEFWLLLLQDYATRFIGSPCCTRWDMGLHYNAQSAVILAVSSMFALKRLQKTKIISRWVPLLAMLIIGNALFLYRFELHGPFALAYNPAFYKHTKDFTFLNDLIGRIPAEVSVMTQNNLAPHFTHQKIFFLTRDYESYKPEYVILDVRTGQNPNNFFGIKDIHGILELLQNDTKYELTYKTKDQFIFRRIRI
ncbi:MAG: hypothetical protein A3H17_02765 [Candidatus Levybacteria bacterium RIFCSPLOWO2_12_FULL_37_14]|nr:MAG: hypothetical protein US55_C0005G0003 [Candidatus Levybacteria bacterium GW2011_GWC2_37_7]KKQ42850.1 MAG: hypothetical protein US59_C0003G0015 [Candidatus Levybacteria bacterium GW2011_GWB1_37_8]OGH51052.1 MAG: hypothetical protein A3H17_02765 [Candidatus Levybacteria bacterium RIFCSPLOWO2_12_FULL_37_14]